MHKRGTQDNKKAQKPYLVSFHILSALWIWHNKSKYLLLFCFCYIASLHQK
jgi:hypothetical protein